jgi:hypothetical protein
VLTSTANAMLSSVPEEEHPSSCSMSPLDHRSPTDSTLDLCFISSSAPASFLAHQHSTSGFGGFGNPPSNSCSFDTPHSSLEHAVAARSVACQVRATSISMETSVLRPINRVRLNRINLLQLSNRLYAKRPRVHPVHVQHPAFNVDGHLFSWVPPSLNDDQVSHF